jgi:hypothetical protein
MTTVSIAAIVQGEYAHTPSLLAMALSCVFVDR